MAGYREHLPSASLAPYVRCYWTHRERPARPRTRQVVPDACLDLIFFLHGPTGAPPALAVGTMTEPLPVRTEGPTDLLGVRFHPGAATAFLPVPASELTDRSVSLDTLWDTGGGEAAERLAALPPGPGRLVLLESLLRGRLARVTVQPDPTVRTAVRILEETRGSVPVAALARAVGLGRRQLGRRFRRSVGVPPRTAGRVLRFQAALRDLQADPRADLSRIALAAGYHDQPHFTREFGEMAGETPGRYRRRRVSRDP